MFVKQVDLQEALRLAGKGIDVGVLVPSVLNPKDLADYETETLAHMLDGCLFFRAEPAMENSDFEAAVQDMTENPPPPTRRELLQKLPPAPRNRRASVWVPVRSAGR